MIDRGLWLALVAACLVAPQMAEAGPVVGFVQGFVAAVSGAAVAGGAGVLAGYTAGVYVAGFFGTIAGRAVLSLGASAVARALQPRPEIPKPSKRLENFAQPVALMERGYGRVKKGGPYAFYPGMRDGVQHWVVTIAAHSTAGPVEHWLDLRQVTLADGTAYESDGSGPNLPAPSGQAETVTVYWQDSLDPGDVITAPYLGTTESRQADGDTIYEITSHFSRISVRPFTGGAGQAADPVLVSEFAEITAAHDFAGHSVVAVSAARPNQEFALKIFPTGREPVYTAVWDMWDEIEDPRDGSVGWSQNWALCWAHELQKVWGLTGPGAARLAIEAAAADVLVTNRTGGQEPAYTFSGVFKDDLDFEQVAGQFLAAANGFLWQRVDGAVDFYSGRWMAPTLTLTGADFFELQAVDGNSGLRPATHYEMEYTEPGKGWRETPSAAFVVDPGGPRVTRRAAVYGITSHNQAMRVLKAVALTDRGRWKLQGVVGLVGFELIGGRDHDGDTTGAGGLAHRFVMVDLPIFDAPVAFEVAEIQINADEMSFSVELTQSGPEFWAFDAAIDEPEPPEYHAEQVADSDLIDPITDLSGAVVEGTGGVAQIRWTWTPPAAGLRPVLRLREQGGDWVELSFQSGAREYVQTGLIDGATYEAQIRAVSGGYDLSEWLPDPAASIEAVANTVAPGAHAGFALSQSGGDVTVEWVAADDSAYHATRVYRADYPAGYSGAYDLSDAALVRTEYGLRGAPDSWVDSAGGPAQYAYWVEPVNASGVAGPVTGPAAIDVP